MPTGQELESATASARTIWEEYQLGRDPAEWDGKTVGVEPSSGRVVIVQSMTELTTPAATVVVRLSAADWQLKRMRWGGRWRRVN